MRGGRTDVNGTSSGIWDGDSGRARLASRTIAKRLVRLVYIDDTNGTRTRQSDWQLLMQNEDEVRSILNDLLLDLRVDRTYRVAWTEDAVAVDEQRYDRDCIKASQPIGGDELLALIELRRRVMVYEAHATTQGAWVITRSDLRDCFDQFPQHSPEKDPSAADRTKAFKRLVGRLSDDGFIRDSGDDILRITPAVPVVMTAATMEAVAKGLSATGTTQDESLMPSTIETTQDAEPQQVSGQTTVFDFLDKDQEG